MSNIRDAMGLCLAYGRTNSQYETEFEPATGTSGAISTRPARRASACIC